jgi:hypothetical protein
MVAEERTPSQSQFPHRPARNRRAARKRRRINAVMQSVPIGDAGVRVSDAPVFRLTSCAPHPRADASVDTHKEAARRELSAPFLTMLVISIPHSLVMIAIDALTRTCSWRESRQGIVTFAMFVAFLIVVPGALAAWFARGTELKLSRWFILAGTEWLFVAATCGIAWESNLPALIDGATVVYFGIPILAALALIITLAMTEPRKRSS